MSFIPQNLTVWTEIPCTDLERSKAFYSTVFDLKLEIQDMGPNPVVMFPTKDKDGVAGHLYPGKPAAKGTGATIHFAVPDDIGATLERIKECGGEVVSPVLEIPAGRFAYCIDVDGNSIGVFQR